MAEPHLVFHGAAVGLVHGRDVAVMAVPHSSLPSFEALQPIAFPYSIPANIALVARMRRIFETA